MSVYRKFRGGFVGGHISCFFKEAPVLEKLVYRQLPVSWCAFCYEVSPKETYEIRAWSRTIKDLKGGGVTFCQDCFECMAGEDFFVSQK